MIFRSLRWLERGVLQMSIWLKNTVMEFNTQLRLSTSFTFRGNTKGRKALRMKSESWGDWSNKIFCTSMKYMKLKIQFILFLIFWKVGNYWKELKQQSFLLQTFKSSFTIYWGPYFICTKRNAFIEIWSLKICC